MEKHKVHSTNRIKKLTNHMLSSFQPYFLLTYHLITLGQFQLYSLDKTNFEIIHFSVVR